jgi:hypothetical protein
VGLNSKFCELKLNSSPLNENCLELKVNSWKLNWITLAPELLLIHHTLKLDMIHSNVEES